MHLPFSRSKGTALTLGTSAKMPLCNLRFRIMVYFYTIVLDLLISKGPGSLYLTGTELGIGENIRKAYDYKMLLYHVHVNFTHVGDGFKSHRTWYHKNRDVKIRNMRKHFKICTPQIFKLKYTCMYKWRKSVWRSQC